MTTGKTLAWQPASEWPLHAFAAHGTIALPPMGDELKFQVIYRDPMSRQQMEYTLSREPKATGVTPQIEACFVINELANDRKIQECRFRKRDPLSAPAERSHVVPRRTARPAHPIMSRVTRSPFLWPEK